MSTEKLPKALPQQVQPTDDLWMVSQSSNLILNYLIDIPFHISLVIFNKIKTVNAYDTDKAQSLLCLGNLIVF